VIHVAPGGAAAPGSEWLAATRFLDHGDPRIGALAARAVDGARTDLERAVRLFYAVRDGWRYDPFAIRLDPEHYVASHIHDAASAYCIPKAILLAAAARAVGIPAGIGLSDVVNHLTTEKLKARMGGSTLFVDHGYAVLHLDGHWVKAAPAFNIELCDRFHVRPTEFDGRDDAVFQEFDALDRRHMEYVADHGFWSDVPYERIVADMQRAYPPALFTDEPAGEKFEDQAPLT
jgi:transglutaminase-like putative cysteine protease